MREQLVILLDPHDLAESTWATVAADGSVSGAARCDAAILAGAKADREVIVLVPAEDVLLLKARLPKMSRQRLLQALPFALEEQLISDIETQHIVPAGESGETTPAAVVAHETMQRWLAQLAEWQIEPDVMLPVSLALPFTEGTWTVAVINTMAVVRSEANQGFAADPTMMVELLTEATAIDLLNYTDATLNLDLPSAIGVQESLRPTQQYLTDLASRMRGEPAMNLLQGRYAVKKSRRHGAKNWTRITVALAGFSLALLLLYPLVSYFILKQRINDINTQIAAIYHQTFPQSTSVVAPKLRMQEKLQQATAQGGSGRMFVLMANVGKSMEKITGIKLKRLQYQHNQLTLEVNADSTADFSIFTNDLKQQGLSVKQQNVNLSGKAVSAVVEVE